MKKVILMGLLFSFILLATPKQVKADTLKCYDYATFIRLQRVIPGLKPIMMGDRLRPLYCVYVLSK